MTFLWNQHCPVLWRHMNAVHALEAAHLSSHTRPTAEVSFLVFGRQGLGVPSSSAAHAWGLSVLPQPIPWMGGRKLRLQSAQPEHLQYLHLRAMHACVVTTAHSHAHICCDYSP